MTHLLVYSSTVHCSKVDEFQLDLYEQGLLFASYPKRINRYNLEFFCNPREAAFCYNWLKRQKNLAQAQSDGDLILNDEFRNQMLDFHKQEEPAQAEEFSTTATIVDAFTSIFPDSDSHWIPINLQLFDSFTKSLTLVVFPVAIT